MIAWVDIETSGLNPDRGCILEIAIALAEDSHPTQVVKWMQWVIRAELDGERVLQGDRACFVDPYVVLMHERNGLWSECLTGIEIAQVEREVLDFLPDGHAATRIAGAGIGNFDLQWIKHHMPRVGRRFSHRVLDVTSVRLFAEDLGMPHETCPKGASHRALDDVGEAIAHYDTCFRFIQERIAKCP